MARCIYLIPKVQFVWFFFVHLIVTGIMLVVGLWYKSNNNCHSVMPLLLCVSFELPINHLYIYACHSFRFFTDNATNTINFRLRSMVAHRNHFVRHLSVCLSSSHTYLGSNKAMFWRQQHAFLCMLPFWSLNTLVLVTKNDYELSIIHSVLKAATSTQRKTRAQGRE